jgi:hypothetical protein
MMRLRRVLISASIVAAGVMAVDGEVSAAPTRVGRETFISIQNLSDNGGGPVTASGVINDTGTDIVVSDTEDTFDFGANGQITVFHSALSSHEHLNTHTCVFTFTERGTYVFGNGTGEWAGYNGSGRYTVVGRATNACEGGEPTGTLTIRASGPINHPTDG